MRFIVLIAVSTGMRSAEIHRLRWSDVRYSEGLLAVREKLKKGKERFVPMTSELAEEIRRYPAVIGQDRIFPPKGGQPVSVRDWKEVLRTCSKERIFMTSGSTIDVTPSHPGT
jgi:integrase